MIQTCKNKHQPKALKIATILDGKKINCNVEPTQKKNNKSLYILVVMQCQKDKTKNKQKTKIKTVTNK